MRPALGINQRVAKAKAAVKKYVGAQIFAHLYPDLARSASGTGVWYGVEEGGPSDVRTSRKMGRGCRTARVRSDPQLPAAAQHLPGRGEAPHAGRAAGFAPVGFVLVEA
ncbi:hypothetical protein RirG_023660 [Rhizophagus irregularis DAOM 197198w]|uniref:Uncharacterized protein n=1 Tax=Rhizophagus irregularis (strain DAOM 197198w) TaxID=1432141 RepID=A0A015LCL5_RHIIW|nr:hypothetical protein RirG_023660 [Rhizophagus irregularis DAOM 197198w]